MLSIAARNQSPGAGKGALSATPFVGEDPPPSQTSRRGSVYVSDGGSTDTGDLPRARRCAVREGRLGVSHTGIGRHPWQRRQTGPDRPRTGLCDASGSMALIPMAKIAGGRSLPTEEAAMQPGPIEITPGNQMSRTHQHRLEGSSHWQAHLHWKAAPRPPPIYRFETEDQLERPLVPHFC